MRRVTKGLLVGCRARRAAEGLLVGWLCLCLGFVLAGCGMPGAGGGPGQDQESGGVVPGQETGPAGEVTGDTNGEPLVVAVSIVPQETFVKAVGGDRVEVVCLVPPGNSPANYAPTPREMARFSQASLYFTLGVPTEEANILPRARENYPDLKVVPLAEEVAQVYPDRYMGGEQVCGSCAPVGRRDPHTWLSPRRVGVMIGAIARELSSLDPANQPFYQENARAYQGELERLDRELQEITGQLESRTFIVYHPAFGYFAEDYGMEMIALERDGKDATPRELEEVIDRARRENIKVIFYQKEIDSRQSQAIAEEIGGRTIQLAPLAPGYLENLENMARTFLEALS